MAPLLSLEEFRRVLGWNPYHYWGLSDPEFTPETASCKDVLHQHNWQGADFVGRDDISDAIESAERLLRDWLGYAVAPEYREVTATWPRYYDTTRVRWGNMDATGRWIGVPLPFGAGQIQAIGVEELTAVGSVTVAGVTLVFTDTDNDGLDDTFTATITVTAGTDPDHIALYFAAADRLDSEAASEKWRIRPVSVSVSGTVATIIGRLWLLVRPILYEGVSVQSLDPTNVTVNGPYAQSLEVYTRHTNTGGTTVETAQALVIWETRPCHGWWCCCGCQSAATLDPTNSPADPSAISTALARAGMRDARLGTVGVGESAYNATTGIWAGTRWANCGGEPDRVTVRIYAGQPLVNGGFTDAWRRTIARLAMAELARPLVACESANRELFRWQQDVALVDGHNEEKYQASEADLACPWGTRRGHIFAWHQVRQLKVTLATIDS